MGEYSNGNNDDPVKASNDKEVNTVTDAMELKSHEESNGKEIRADEQMAYDYGHPQEQSTEENPDHTQTKQEEDTVNDTRSAESENKFAYHDNHYEEKPQNNAEQNPKNDASPMDLKDWVLTLVVLLIPCVGIVMYFVWAFGDKGNINRRNFCRAQLIIFGVLLVIYVVFFLLFGSIVTRTMTRTMIYY